MERRTRLAGLAALAAGMAWAAVASRERRLALERELRRLDGSEASAEELRRRLDATRERLRREISPSDGEAD